MPLPLPAARWQSFGSPPEAPELLLLSEGLPASAPAPVELLPTALPSMLPPPVALVPEAPLLVPEAPLLDDVLPLELPELPEDWAMADVARARASAEVARIFKIMSFTFMGWIIFAGAQTSGINQSS
ncbi:MULTISPECIES: hypothetical protein [unclassified Rhizobium]|uniref:hypothetical protein n=1 Tax=unclassified Rhizobium TaxID=2613769 RepID=UPI001496162B|nr:MULTISPECIES: hypothetical protein [unclassified Rhizobium]